MSKKDYKDWDRKDLIEEIENLRKRKKYGLVWEDKPEDVVERCKKELPVLKEIKGKEINSNENSPTNILIEGDNYHALSVLNYTHKGKVDVIYIDPPYNTGNKDFIYNDHYVDKEDSYRHSKWLAFMSERLRLAKGLLKRNGVIFISIDDNEIAQLKMLCDTIFGEDNLIANIVRRRRKSQANLSKNLSTIHEYLLCYGRSAYSNLNKVSSDIKREDYKNPDNDSRGPYVTMPCSNKGGARYNIETPSGKVHKDEWRFKKDTFNELLEDNRIVFPNNGKGKPRYKLFYKEKIKQGVIANSWWDDVASNQEASKELKTILNGKKVFDNPKPVGLLKRILELSSKKDSIILDFFAGSGTTGHAVLELNREDSGNRKFILSTNNEENNGNGKIIDDICYPRIQKVIKGYKNGKEKIEGFGGNLKYFRTSFVPANPTDKNKTELTKKATEMLCVREDAFDLVKDEDKFKLFKGKNHYTGIVFDQLAIPNFKKAIARIKLPVSVYVFSLGDDTFDSEFEDVKDKVTVSPIPKAILRVYRRIFK